MAQKMGYKNYVEFGYKQLSRLEYDAKMVGSYRKQVLEKHFGSAEVLKIAHITLTRSIGIT